MRKLWIFGMLTLLALIGGCKQSNCDSGISTCDESKWRDPNYNIIGVGAYNYTKSDIFDAYIMPIDKSDIAFAGRISVGPGTPKDAKAWNGQGGNSPNMAWDLRWKAPYKFKLWWNVIFDKKLYAESRLYDPYTSKQSKPGTAWCEYEIEVNEPYGERHGRDPYPNMVRDEFNLYFYPDGTVKGHIEFGFDAEVPSVEQFDITKRDQLQVLNDRACLKEVPNPLYGKTKPIPMY